MGWIGVGRGGGCGGVDGGGECRVEWSGEEGGGKDSVEGGWRGLKGVEEWRVEVLT